MKLIIDIPSELAEKGHWYTDKEMWTVIKAAQNGIPLDKIRAEIEQLYTVDTVYEDVIAVDKADVLQIIDKYR